MEKENDKQDYDRGCTISLSGSNLTWEDVDNAAHKLGLNRSRYVQQALNQKIKGNKGERNKEIILYSIILLTFFALILNIIGVI